MRKYFFVFLFLPLAVFSQEQLIVKEDFATDKKGWVTYKGDTLVAKINNGVYEVNNYSSSSTFHYRYLNAYDNDKNFSISVATSFVMGTAENPFGLVFGSSPDKAFYFAINSMGYYGIISFDSIPKLIVPLTRSEAINTGSGKINKLIVKRESADWKFFINDQMVKTIPARSFYGFYSGFYADNRISVNFDDFTITGTPVKTEGILCELLPLLLKSKENNFELVKGKKVTEGLYDDILKITDFPSRYLDYGVYSTQFYVGLATKTTEEKAKQAMESVIKSCGAYQFKKDPDASFPRYKLYAKENGTEVFKEATVAISQSSDKTWFAFFRIERPKVSPALSIKTSVRPTLDPGKPNEYIPIDVAVTKNAFSNSILKLLDEQKVKFKNILGTQHPDSAKAKQLAQYFDSKLCIEGATCRIVSFFKPFLNFEARYAAKDANEVKQLAKELIEKVSQSLGTGYYYMIGTKGSEIKFYKKVNNEMRSILNIFLNENDVLISCGA